MNSVLLVSRRIAAAIVAALISIYVPTAFGASDTWNQTGGTANWLNGANWLSGTQYPNGSGDVASFTNNITSGQTVTNGSGVTVGGINLGDSTAPINNFVIGATANTINLDNGSSATVINNLAGNNTIYAKLIATGANKDLTLNVTGGNLSIGDASISSVMNIHTLTINMSGSTTLTLGPGGSTISDTNVFINGVGTVFSDGQSLPTNSILTLKGGGTIFAVGGGRAQDLAEVRGTGMFRGPGGASGRMVVGAPNANYSSITFGGTIVTNGGIVRPGDTNGFGQIGVLASGNTSATSPLRSETGAKYYFDIAGYTSFDQIDVPRTTSTINGGDVLINLMGGFHPTNGAQFRLFIDSSTGGFLDGNGGKLFDNILNANTGGTNFFFSDDLWTAQTVDTVLAPAGGATGRNIVFTYVIPEPTAAGLLFMSGVMLFLRRRQN